MTETPIRKRSRNIARQALASARRGVDHSVVALAVYDNGGLSGRYLMMTVISASIAVLGLMLGSPAVVIGAMLVSPMMGPIVALGFSLTLLDWEELKRAVKAIAIGVGLALLVAVILTAVSPLKEPTGEILARTRPNFFDLLIAVFSGIAGAYAVIRQRGETIIGVAIATALMPPVATVGFGLGTGELSIAGGAFFLFMTNLVAIALAATMTATFFGFRARQRSVSAAGRRWRELGVILVFILLAAPLALSLRAIGQESRATAETRLAIAEIFDGRDSRITLLTARSDGDRVTVSALISTRELVSDAQSRLNDRLAAAMHLPVEVTLDQIVVADPEAASRALQAAETAPDPSIQLRNRILEAVPFETDSVLFDSAARTVVIQPGRSSGLDLQASVALERGLARRFPDLSVRVIPPIGPLADVDLADGQARALTAWALARWRAEPSISLCAPTPAPEPEEGAEPGPDAGETLLSELAAAGVTYRRSEVDDCRRTDANLARFSLDADN